MRQGDGLAAPGEPVPDQPVRLPVELIVRASCGGSEPRSAPPARTGLEAR